jgi:hypothetical protein
MVTDGFHVRRVVVGRGDRGAPVILSDESPPLTIDAPSGFGVSELLSSAGPLTSVDDGGDPPREGVGAFPANGGVAARLIRFPVTGEWVRIAGDDPDRPGMHRSETLDLMVVLSGRILLGVEDGEEMVDAGDSVIQRGTLHRWQVTGDGPCTYLSVLLAPFDGASVTSPQQTPLQGGAGPELFVTGTGSQGSTIEFKGTSAPDEDGRRHWWNTGGPVRSVDQGGIGGEPSGVNKQTPGAVSLTLVDLDGRTPAFRTNPGCIDLVLVMAGSVATSLDANATESPSGPDSRTDQLSLAAGDVLIAREVALPLASSSARLALVSFVPSPS